MIKKFLGVIPARYASSRFPGKPLVDIHGKSMIEWVYKRTQLSSYLSELIVATDDQRIFDCVTSFGGKVEFTSSSHRSGTERISEIAERYPSYDGIINIQGDEPYIDPKAIDRICEGIMHSNFSSIFTLISIITDKETLENPNTVKVVINLQGKALYFSRHPIPFNQQHQRNIWLDQHLYFKHIGIYGFPRNILLRIPALEMTALETAESLEQLRWIAHGYDIFTAEYTDSSLSVDTPEDLEKLLQLPIPDYV